MKEQSVTPIQVRTTIYIIKKHKWKVMGLFVLGILTGVISSLTVPITYETSAQLLIKPGRADVYVSPIGKKIIEGASVTVNTEIAILKSLDLAKKLVDRVGLNRFFDYPDRTFKNMLSKVDKKVAIPPPDEAYKMIRASLAVLAVPKSSVIKITFSWPDPSIAVEAVNTWLDLYLIQRMHIHNNPATRAFFSQEVTKWEKRLKASEEKLETFKRDHSINSLSEQRRILLPRLVQADLQNEQIKSQIQGTQVMIAALEAQLSNLDQDVQIQALEYENAETLAALKAKLVDLELQGLKEDINQVKKKIAKEENKKKELVVLGKSPLRQNLEISLLKEKARLEGLRTGQRELELRIVSQEEQLKKLVETLKDFDKDLKRHGREVSSDEANYNLYRKNFEEASISASMDNQNIVNVSVVEHPVLNLNPVPTRKKLYAPIGGFLGIMVGISLVFFIEFINPVFHSSEDVRQFLSLPVLATIPKQQQDKILKKRSRPTIIGILVTLVFIMSLLAWTHLRKGWQRQQSIKKPIQVEQKLDRQEKGFEDLGEASERHRESS